MRKRPRAAGRSGNRLALLCLCVGMTACQLSGPPPSAPPDDAPRGPALEAGSIDEDARAEAQALLEEAERSFEARRFFEVRRITADLMERFPASAASGAALLLSARADLELGALGSADAAAGRYAALLPAGDPRTVDALLIQVEATQGDPAAQLERLLRIPDELTEVQRASLVPVVRAAVEELEPEELEAVLADAPPDGPLAPIAQVGQAVNILDAGNESDAARLARTALALGLPEPERSIARGVIEGELPEGRRRVRAFEVATVLPVGGPPALADFASLVAEGIEVASATVLGDDYQVSLAVRDDEGDPALSAERVAELEARGVAGVVGFLEDEALEAAGRARDSGLLIVSPTARMATSAGEGVYSLEGADPRAAAAMARYAAFRAHQRVAIVLPESGPGVEEADAFEAEAAIYGVPVVGRFTYLPGATFFEPQLNGAQDVLRASEIAALGLTADDTLRVEMLEPVGVFMPIPPEDVEYLAPQIAHFALDTLAIEVIGTSGWTDPQVLAAVEPRYLDGIVATAPVGAGPDAPGYRRFETAYEEYFQRSLVSSTPALGYDAALLLLEALRPGRPRPEEVLESFRGLRDVEGATGIFSVIDDRVLRRTRAVAIERGDLRPIVVD